MEFFLVLVALAGAGVVYFARRADHATLAAEPDPVQATRALGLGAWSGQDPIAEISDSRLAIAAAALAFLQLQDSPPGDCHARIAPHLSRCLDLDPAPALQALLIGDWLVAQCDSPDTALSQLTWRLYALEGAASLPPLFRVLRGSLSGNLLSVRQRDALETVSQIYDPG